MHQGTQINIDIGAIVSGSFFDIDNPQLSSSKFWVKREEGWKFGYNLTIPNNPQGNNFINNVEELIFNISGNVILEPTDTGFKFLDSKFQDNKKQSARYVIFDFSDIPRSFNINQTIVTDNETITKLIPLPYIISKVDENILVRFNVTDLVIVPGTVVFDPLITINDISTFGSTNKNITTSPYPYAHISINNTLRTDLVLYLPFDFINRSFTEYDWGNFGLNGTLNGPNWTSQGMFGGAFVFDGIKNNITVADNPLLDRSQFRNALTISVWIKANQLQGGRRIIAKGDDAGAVPSYGLEVQSNGNISLGRDGSTTMVQTKFQSYWPDQWVHVAITKGEMIGNVQIYINGTAAPNQSQTLGNFTNNANQLFIGSSDCNVCSGTVGFNGTIDEVMIWNRTLSADEIMQIYNQTLYRFRSPASMLFGQNNPQVLDFLNTSRSSARNSTATVDAPASTNPPTATSTVFNDAMIGQVNVSDNIRASQLISDDNDGYQLFNISTDKMEGIISFNFTWEGFYNSDGGAIGVDNATLYLRNISGSSWYNCGAQVGDTTSDVMLGCYIPKSTTNITDFFDSNNNTYLLVFASDANDGGTVTGILSTDYVALNLFKPGLDIGQNGTLNNINITTNSSILNNTNISLRILEFNSSGDNIENTSAMNLSHGNDKVLNFAINNQSVYVQTEFVFLPDSFNFYSPVLLDGFSINSYFLSPATFGKTDVNVSQTIGLRQGQGGKGAFIRESFIKTAFNFLVNGLQYILRVTYQTFTIISSNFNFKISDFPKINFIDLSPANGSTTTNSSVQINISIVESNLSRLDSVNFNWNGTNYTIYNNSLVLFYNFDNRSSLTETSTRIVDISQYGNNATAKSNVIWNASSDKYHGAFEFKRTANNSNDGINVTSTLSMNLTTGFTITAWVRIYDNKSQLGASNDDMTIFSKGNRVFHLSIASNRRLSAGTTGLSDNSVSSNAIILQNDIWYHVAFKYNGTDICDYVNAIRDDCDPSTGALSTSTVDSGIGAQMIGTLRSLNGSIDEFMLWNLGLDDSFIKELYYSNLYKYNKGTTRTLNNDTTLSFVSTLTAQTHWINIQNITPIQNANLTVTFSGFILGGLDIFINGVLIGNITAGETSPKLFSDLNATSGNNNITYIPELSSTATISQSNLTYKEIETSQWYLYVNQSNLTSGTYTLFGSVKDVGTDENMTDIRYLNVVIGAITEKKVFQVITSTQTIFSKYFGQSKIFDILSIKQSGRKLSNMFRSRAILLRIKTGQTQIIGLVRGIFEQIGLKEFLIRFVSVTKSIYQNLLLTFGLIGNRFSDIPMVFFAESPFNGTSTTNRSQLINVSISTDYSPINKVKFNWNNTIFNYTLYDDSLILLYGFNNISAISENDTDLIDVSRISNNGLLLNGTRFNKTGRWGSNIDLDGINDYVLINNNSRFKSSNISISFWTKLNSTTGTFISKVENDSEYYSVSYSSGSVIWDISGYQGCNFPISADYNLSDNFYHHIFVGKSIINSTRTNYTLAIDGNLKNAQTNNLECNITTNGNLVLGKFSDTDPDFLNGSLDELKIWNRSLSNDEIKQEYYSNLYRVS